MRTAYWDLFILSCIYLDVAIVATLIWESFDSSLNVLYLVSIPLGFFVVSGFALFTNRLMVRRLEKKPFKFRQTFAVFGRKKDPNKVKKNRLLGRKTPGASPVQMDLGMHNCPVHGTEKCAGNYLNLHSCNGPTVAPSRQIFWEEVPREETKVETVAGKRKIVSVPEQ